LKHHTKNWHSSA